MRNLLTLLPLLGCSSPPPAVVPLPAAAVTLSARTPWFARGLSFAGAGKPLPLAAEISGAALAAVTVTVAALSPGGSLLAGAAMTGGPRSFEAAFPTAGLPDGPLLLVATARDSTGGSWRSAPVPVTLDQTPPRVTLRLPALGAAPLPRDFTADATVDADDGDGAGLVSFELQGVGVPQDATAIWPLIEQGDYPGPGAEGQARVRGLDLRLDTGPDGGLGGAFTLVATAVDGVGNVGSARLQLPVTRLRWRLDGPAFSTAPVLGRHGRVLVGDASGRLWAVTPEGAVAWSAAASALPLQATPLVWSRPSGPEAVFVPTGEGRVDAREVADGTPVRGFSFAAAGRAFDRAGALDAVGSALALASDDGALWLLDARSGTERGSLAPSPRDPSAPTAVSLDGSLGLLGRGGGALWLFDVAPPGPELRATFTLPGGLSALEGDAPALAGGAAWLAGRGGAFTLPDLRGGPAVLGPEAVAAGPLGFGAVVDGDGDAFAAGDLALVELRPGGEAGYVLPLRAAAAGPPTLGADGVLYLSTRDGQLEAVSKAGAPLWSAPLAAGADHSYAAVIDRCRRTLYLAVSSGSTGSLWALAVDSPGLDARPGAWPHFRHDEQGTGNARTAGAADCAP
ncbi:MAG: hypothetical protein ACYDCL_19200 [Myxococcales bacterium]